MTEGAPAPLERAQAKWPQRCLICDKGIEPPDDGGPGDSIVQHPDAGWVHEDCAIDEGFEVVDGDA